MEMITMTVAPVPTGPRSPILRASQPSVCFTEQVGGAVRLRRPEHKATLHFLWLCVAFFGVFTFSFSGPLDPLDWVFYWGDAIAMLMLPPLFLHFMLVFPDRPRRSADTRSGRNLIPLLYLPAVAARGCRSPRPSARADDRAGSRSVQGWSIAPSCSTSPFGLDGGLGDDSAMRRPSHPR